MYQRSISTIKQSIFPIFFAVNQGDRTSIGVSGTGFFIDDDGHFITAHHVISNVPDGAQLLYAGNIPNNHIRPTPVQEIIVDEARDIYIGQVQNNALPPVNVFRNPTEVGTSVCLCGYPMASLSLNQDGSINVTNVRQYWQPTFAIDNAQVNKDGRHYRGFMTQDTSLRGMSGGPVFDVDSNVHGIDVASVARRIPQQNGDDMLINNGIVVGFHSIGDLLDQLNDA